VKVKATGAPFDQILLSVNGAAQRLVSALDLKNGIDVETRSVARLVHNPARVGPVLAGEDLCLAVRVLFDRPVQSVTLHHRGVGSPWSTSSAQVDGRGRWSACIPASQVISGQRLDYYFEAQASSGTSYAPEVDPADVPFWQVPG
jgi:hypothetical protein